MKRPAALRDAIAGLWSDDGAERARSAKALTGLAIDMVDIRSAQPALVWAMSDADPAVRRSAVEATEMRADLGCDIGLAVPALLELAGDPDVELRRLVWRALRYANPRTRFADRVPDVIERGLRDGDADVVTHARTLAAVATPRAPAPSDGEITAAPKAASGTPKAKAKARPNAPVKAKPEAKAKAPVKAPVKAKPEAKAKAPVKAKPEAKAKARPKAPVKAKPEAKAKARPKAPVKAKTTVPEARATAVAATAKPRATAKAKVRTTARPAAVAAAKPSARTTAKPRPR